MECKATKIYKRKQTHDYKDVRYTFSLNQEHNIMTQSIFDVLRLKPKCK